MLIQSDDMFSSVISCEAAHEPGNFWNYSGGDADLLSGLIRKAIGEDDEYHGYAYSQLFHRIGILNTVVETDASCLFVASSFSYGTVRDWARFGLLFLNNGIFEGDTVLTPEWANYMRTPAPKSDGNYAATFWLKEPTPENALVDVPADVFFCRWFPGTADLYHPLQKAGSGAHGIQYEQFQYE